MTGYEYGNARLHAMKSRLLSHKELEGLLDSGSLQGLIAALTRTVYHKSLEAALTRTSGLECINETLRTEMISELKNVRTFFRGQPAHMVAIILRTYDIHNLKTIIRGLSKNVPTGEILAAFIPVGELDYATLVELVNARDPRAAIDLLASQNLPFAQPLLNLRAERTHAGSFEMELALERWHFQEAMRFLEKKGRGHKLLLEALALESDLTNLITVLRFAHSPLERNYFREMSASENLSSLFVGPGHLPFALLAQAGSQDSLEAVAATLAETPYQAVLQNGLEAHAHSGLLSRVEKELRRFRLKKMTGLIAKDPLGIGVVLGYFELKINEINNIRWIAHGLNLGLKVDAIRSEVEYVQ